MTARELLGESLIATGLLGRDQLRIALQEQRKQRQPLGKLLIGLGFISESTLRQSLSAHFSYPSIELAHATPDAAALGIIPESFARRWRVLPLALSAAPRCLTVAVADPEDLPCQDRLRATLPDDIALDMMLASESEIEQAIDRFYGHELSIEGILHELDSGQPDLSLRDDSYRHPIVRLVDALLTDAVKRGASDIHFEPESGFLRIRYRLDGMLRQIRVLDRGYWPPMCVRLKVMAGMDIAECRAPQDGHIDMTVSGRTIDFRVSSQPTLHGENLVLRILDRQKGIRPLADLGLDDSARHALDQVIKRPEGITLFTGPTGSGKTTSLYSLVQALDCEALNIMTLEDPVEYPLPRIRQTSVGDAVKLNFADGIRAILRQDPDVILVGEIRDAETASMAFRAAMTGHRVLTTLHSNSAIGAIPRLVDIGISHQTLSGNIAGIIAQRLLRRLCPQCKQPGGEFHRPAGCPACDFSGYSGRLAIMEVLRVDSGFDDLLARRATLDELRAYAAANGFVTLAEQGLRKVENGETSLPELERVIDLGARAPR